MEEIKRERCLLEIKDFPSEFKCIKEMELASKERTWSLSPSFKYSLPELSIVNKMCMRDANLGRELYEKCMSR